MAGACENVKQIKTFGDVAEKAEVNVRKKGIGAKDGGCESGTERV